MGAQAAHVRAGHRAVLDMHRFAARVAAGYSAAARVPGGGPGFAGPAYVDVLQSALAVLLEAETVPVAVHGLLAFEQDPRARFAYRRDAARVIDVQAGVDSEPQDGSGFYQQVGVDPVGGHVAAREVVVALLR